MMTFIRCPGNKSKHIRKFIEFLPKEFNTYIEPFLGSGAVFLYMQPTKWIINDTNNLLINLWEMVKEKPKIVNAFMESAKVLLNMSKAEKKTFLEQKLVFYHKTKNIRRKSLLYLLFKCCFYMGYFNSNITSLDPSLMKNKIFCLSDRFQTNILNISHALNTTNGQILSKDYRAVLQRAKKGDFIFLDPPYLEDKEYQFVYNPSKIQPKFSLVELAQECKILDAKEVKWLMTQADTLEVRKLFQKYDIREYLVFRSRSQTYKNELVIRNYR